MGSLLRLRHRRFGLVLVLVLVEGLGLKLGL
jgi:hypothetical protein